MMSKNAPNDMVLFVLFVCLWPPVPVVLLTCVLPRTKGCSTSHTVYPDPGAVSLFSVTPPGILEVASECLVATADYNLYSPRGVPPPSFPYTRGYTVGAPPPKWGYLCAYLIHLP